MKIKKDKRLPIMVGNQIKAARLDQGLKQDDLAKITGLSRSQIAQWESQKRNPMMSNFDLVANALGMSSDELMHYRSDPNTELQRLAKEMESNPIETRIKLINEILPGISEKGLDEVIEHLNNMIFHGGDYVRDELKKS